MSGFDFPERVVKAYTEGDCGYLATAMHAVSGFPIVTASIDVPGEWLHAGVLTPEGTVLDIEGTHSVEDWLDKWLGDEPGEEHFAHEWNAVEFLKSRNVVAAYYGGYEEWAPKVLAAYHQIV